MSVNVRASFDNIEDNNIVFGSRTTGTYSTSTDQFYSGVYSLSSEDVYSYSGKTRSSIIQNPQSNVFYEWECSNDKVTGTSTYPIYLFALNNKGTNTTPTKIKIAYFKIFENGSLVRNMIPCYRKIDNVVGMYDLVNHVFYTNQGTGTFLKGNNTL